MPLRRKSYKSRSRRRITKIVKFSRDKARRNNPMRSGYSRLGMTLPGVYNFKRKTDQCYTFDTGTHNNAAIGCGASTEKIVLMGFSFECLPNDSEFAVLFKYYRIRGVKVRIIMGQNISDLGGSAIPNNMPYIYTAYAPDDSNATTPTTLQQLRERQNCRSHFPTGSRRVVQHYIANPRIADEVGDMGGSGNVLVASNYRGWLPLDNRRLVHNGLLVGIDNNLNRTEITVQLEFTYYFQCKQVC